MARIKTVKMEITKNQLAFFSKLKNKWVNERGTFEVLVGSSSRDIRLKGNFEIR
jgi:beta-glucosidase